ncbi:hypothetical protein [Palleronia sp.]|uniref:hypothetical protein n=1 Tax=Palleronia sp. TaxID=1940284 RepID=UPI0035C7DEB2
MMTKNNMGRATAANDHPPHEEGVNAASYEVALLTIAGILGRYCAEEMPAPVNDNVKMAEDE